MSNTKAVSDLLDLLYYKPKSVQTILNIMSHSDEDDYDVYSAIYSGNYEHYYQLILEAAGKLFKARILQEYDLLYKLDFCDLFDVLPILAPINNLLDIYKDKNNVNALEQAYKNGLEAAKEEAVRSLKTSLPIPDSKLDRLASLVYDLRYNNRDDDDLPF